MGVDDVIGEIDDVISTCLKPTAKSVRDIAAVALGATSGFAGK